MNESTNEVINIFNLLKEKGDENEIYPLFEQMFNQNKDLLNSVNDKGESFLLSSVKNRKFKISEFLIDQGVNVNITDQQRFSALHWSVYLKNYELSEKLLKNQADWRLQDADQFTPAFYAVFTNNQSMLDLLNRYGDDFQQRGFFDGTLLHYATSAGSEEITDYLIKKGLDINARSINQESPLEWAMYKGNHKVIKVLLEHGAQINHYFDIWGNCALTAAILANSIESVKLLLENGADINEKNDMGRTPLHTAVSPANERINLQMVTYLVDHGADYLALNNEGASVLMWAVRYSDLSIVQYLLDKGCNVEPVEIKNGYVTHSVLHNALYSGNDAILDLILNQVEEVNFIDESGKTPLLLAVEIGNTRAVNRLIDKNADLSAVDKWGRNALHYAAMCGYEDLITLLIDKKINKKEKDLSGYTPFHYAKMYHFYHIVSLLNEKNKPLIEVKTRDVINQKIKEKQALVFYLGHSGWAIKTKNHLLIFDYFNNSRIPLDASLLNGYLVPSELKDLDVTVFVSYLCPDHFDSSIFQLAKEVKACTFIYGFNPNKITPYEGPEYIQMELNQTRMIQDMEITTLLSNVGGAGYLVKVDGLSIFHPGEHTERALDHLGPYCGEIDFIARKDTNIDLAFFAIHGDYMPKPEVVLSGVQYAMQKLKPKVIFPMHAGKKEYLYLDFINQITETERDTSLVAMQNRGDVFIYK